jgi:hypothetical protein
MGGLAFEAADTTWFGTAMAENDNILSVFDKRFQLRASRGRIGLRDWRQRSPTGRDGSQDASPAGQGAPLRWLSARTEAIRATGLHAKRPLRLRPPVGSAAVTLAIVARWQAH